MPWWDVGEVLIAAGIQGPQVGIARRPRRPVQRRDQCLIYWAFLAYQTWRPGPIPVVRLWEVPKEGRGWTLGEDLHEGCAVAFDLLSGTEGPHTFFSDNLPMHLRCMATKEI